MPTPRNLKIMQERHKILHKTFDELLACFINETKKTPAEATLEEFIQWSHAMTLNPTCASDKNTEQDATHDDEPVGPPRSGL